MFHVQACAGATCVDSHVVLHSVVATLPGLLSRPFRSIMSRRAKYTECDISKLLSGGAQHGQHPRLWARLPAWPSIITECVKTDMCTVSGDFGGQETFLYAMISFSAETTRDRLADVGVKSLGRVRLETSQSHVC